MPAQSPEPTPDWTLNNTGLGPDHDPDPGGPCPGLRVSWGPGLPWRDGCEDVDGSVPINPLYWTLFVLGPASVGLPGLAWLPGYGLWDGSGERAGAGAIQAAFVCLGGAEGPQPGSGMSP